MSNLKLRVEITDNGAIITNRATNSKTVNRSTAPAIEQIKNFVSDGMKDEVPGKYFDLDITITPQAIGKPNAATSAPKAKVVVKAKRKK